ncbi:hypothetical protein [Bradyrhizobium sp. 197]|nr:hypothetical protein [Bradyrhizobium sp. 197]
MERTLYGTRSERLRSDTPTDEQIAFVFDEIATTGRKRSTRVTTSISTGR